jgi:hypothetical protein
MFGDGLEIISADEYMLRKDIRRTNLYNRRKSGELIEGVDYQWSGGKLEFVWPPRDRVQLLKNREEVMKKVKLLIKAEPEPIQKPLPAKSVNPFSDNVKKINALNVKKKANF